MYQIIIIRHRRNVIQPVARFYGRHRVLLVRTYRPDDIMLLRKATQPGVDKLVHTATATVTSSAVENAADRCIRPGKVVFQDVSHRLIDNINQKSARCHIQRER